MIFTDPQAFLAGTKEKKLLALDVGQKNIGVATGNRKNKISSPVTTIVRKKFALDTAELKKLIAEYDAGGLIIGLPLNMDGSEGKMCQSVRQFARNLLKEFDVPIMFYDERLSTSTAEGLMAGKGAKAKDIKDKNDMLAAAIILQNFLNGLD